MLLGIFAQYTMFGIHAAFLTDLFPTKLRYSGITLARESAYAVFGGSLPLVATAVVAAAGGKPWPVSVIMLVMGLASAACYSVLPPVREKLAITQTAAMCRPTNRALKSPSLRRNRRCALPGQRGGHACDPVAAPSSVQRPGWDRHPHDRVRRLTNRCDHAPAE